MRRWAVGYINSYNNDLLIEIVSANTWQEALAKHSQVKGDDYLTVCPTLARAKELAFDAECAIDVVQIPTDPELLKLKDLQSRDRWPDTTGGQNL